ncbi:hypothetical protein BJ875DRAFT_483477 [Amylocarpus encephaloides]|uniref:AB hydrolase-1 domain-containing protein n=1 Tax=Amylocarpus encephaloides TaxID=45428 RepID=A0A9P7YJT6_9HELO|nr:hypothetical protein BJ875DRAFT_483477 [Amylocarpus encephaloides]
MCRVPPLSPRTSPTISWKNCINESDPPNLQCGSIQVPVDYGKPHCEHFNLTFARIKTNGISCLGSLVYNPGGPGGAGSDVVFAHVLKGISVWSAELLAQYDLIGLDPRGTGLSNPMKCDPTIWNQRVSMTPQNEEEFNQLVENNKAFSESCRNLTGPIFDFMDTASAAKDMDMVRRALQEDKLNFLGQSYDSQLGSRYAGLFPQNIGRMVLDGITDVSLPGTAQLLIKSNTYESTLNEFFKWCNTTIQCALINQDAPGIFDKLIGTANTNPIPAPGCSPLSEHPCRSDATSEEILTEVQLGLIGFNGTVSFTGWPALSLGILEASKGNATLLSRPIITTPTSSDFSFLGVACFDCKATSISHIDLLLKRQMTSTLSPHTLGATQTYQAQAQCTGWAAPATNTNHALKPKKIAQLPELLLVNSLWDPSTSIVWANLLREQLLSARLVLRKGAGHTSYFAAGETSRAMDGFLLRGELPEQGTTFKS